LLQINNIRKELKNMSNYLNYEEDEKESELEEIEELLEEAKKLEEFYPMGECIGRAMKIKEDIKAYSVHNKSHIKEIDDIIEYYNDWYEGGETYDEFVREGWLDD
jgi:hypothetical protein